MGQERSTFQGGKVLSGKEHEAWKNPGKTSVAGAGEHVRMPKHEAGAGLGTGTPGLWPSCSVGDVGLRTTGEI